METLETLSPAIGNLNIIQTINLKNFYAPSRLQLDSSASLNSHYCFNFLLCFSFSTACHISHEVLRKIQTSKLQNSVSLKYLAGQEFNSTLIIIFAGHVLL